MNVYLAPTSRVRCPSPQINRSTVCGSVCTCESPSPAESTSSPAHSHQCMASAPRRRSYAAPGADKLGLLLQPPRPILPVESALISVDTTTRDSVALSCLHTTRTAPCRSAAQNHRTTTTWHNFRANHYQRRRLPAKTYPAVSPRHTKATELVKFSTAINSRTSSRTQTSAKPYKGRYV